MDRNQGNQGNKGSHGGSSRGLGNMDQDDLHRGAQKGGETSSHEQGRDDQGQFTGKTTDTGTGSVRGGFSQGQGGSHSGGQGGGSHSGGQGGNPGMGSSRSGGQGSSDR